MSELNFYLYVCIQNRLMDRLDVDIDICVYESTKFMSVSHAYRINQRYSVLQAKKMVLCLQGTCADAA